MNKAALLCFSIILSGFDLFSQDYLGYTKSEIIKFDRKLVNPGYTLSFYDTIRKMDTIDHLRVDIDGGNNIRCDYFFDIYGACDSISLVYQCSECAESGIKEVLSEKYRKWKAFDGGVYISRFIYDKIKKDDETYVSSPLLEIKKTPGEQICTTIYLSLTPFMPKDQWKLLVRR